MKRHIAPVLIILALAGTAAAETRDLSGFRSVHAEDRLTVSVTSGDHYSVEVTGADAARVRTRLDGRTLYIEDARRPWFGRSPRLDAQVRIAAPSLERVSAARGADLSADFAGRHCDDFSAAAAMGGEASIMGLECDTVSSSAAMGGSIRIAGTCRTARASAAMGGSIRAEALRCETVDASASMGGDINAFASQTYDASASMGGSINVAGGGRATDTSAAMGGSITSR